METLPDDNLLVWVLQPLYLVIVVHIWLYKLKIEDQGDL
jgi:hypothetical protein